MGGWLEELELRLALRFWHTAWQNCVKRGQGDMRPNILFQELIDLYISVFFVPFCGGASLREFLRKYKVLLNLAPYIFSRSLVGFIRYTFDFLPGLMLIYSTFVQNFPETNFLTQNTFIHKKFQ